MPGTDGQIPDPSETGATPEQETSALPVGDSPALPAGVPERLGRYRVKQLIGTGGMGAIYLAEQESPRKLVAVKVLKDAVSGGGPTTGWTEALKRFQSEAQILASLRHPGIADVYDAGVQPHQGRSVAYFAMEYIPGALSITEYARAHRLTAQRKLELMAKVCEAVACAHRLGIVHRDLKPGNILVDAAGEPKVIDFGVARAALADLGDIAGHSDANLVIGTVQYMAPEQVRPAPHLIGPATDVYALGVILYQLLCGTMPYDLTGESAADAARMICDRPPKSPSAAPARLRGDLEQLLLRTLRKNPHERPNSADDLAREIREYLDRQRPLVELAAASSRFMRRHLIGTAILAALIAAGVAESFGVPLVYHWTGLHDGYMAALARVAPAEPTHSSTAGALRHSRVVRLTDEAAARAPELAEHLGIPGVDPDQWVTMRRLHGHVMKRLARAGARTVAWDITFSSESDSDEAFLEGVAALREAGADVIVTVPDWRLDERARPIAVNPAFVKYVHWGGVTGSLAAWELDLVIQRDVFEPMPSLVLATVGAYRNPGWRTAVTIDRHASVAQLTWYRPVERGGRQWLPGEQLRVRLSGFHDADDEPEVGIAQGDVIGLYLFTVPSDRVLEASTIDYDWLLEASDTELASSVRGKVVMIGDFREVVGDTWANADGRVINACYGHAAALDAILSDAPILLERELSARAAIAVAAVIGVITGFCLGGRTGRRVAAVAVVLVFAGGIAIIVFHQYRIILNPIVPGVALVLGSELAAFAHRIRRTVHT